MDTIAGGLELAEITPIHPRRVKAGDLLAWSSSTKGNFMGRFVQDLIRMMTLSEYAHVGVAVMLNGIPHVLEAVQPKIVVRPLRKDETYYVVPMEIDETKDLYDFMKEYVGLKYSIMDCIYAFLGTIKEKDNRWQCAELAIEIYEKLGIDFNPSRKTPSEVVKTALTYSQNGMWIHQQRVM